MTGNLSKNKARLIVMAIFIIGFTAGALSMNLYERLNHTGPSKGDKPPVFITRKIDERVNLSSEQQARIKAILEETFDQYNEIRKDMDPKLKEFEPRFQEVRRKSRERIRAELTEGQVPGYEKLMEEEDKRREENKPK
jgi:hypothetical protein